MSDTVVLEKKCPGCGVVKSADLFHKDKHQLSGLVCRCKSCLKNPSPGDSKISRTKIARSRYDGEIRRCATCETEQPVGNFSKLAQGIDGLQSRCKKCSGIAAKNMRSKWTIAERQKRARGNLLMTKFGMTVDEYDSILKRQGGVCAICLNPETWLYSRTGEVKRLAVDHCHTTGKVRGLLCVACNTSLGKFKDDTRILLRAVDYLNKSRRAV